MPGAIERVQAMRQQPSDPDAGDSRVYSLYTPGHFTGQHLMPDEIDGCPDGAPGDGRAGGCSLPFRPA